VRTFANPKLIQHHVIAHRSKKRVAQIYGVAKSEPYGFPWVFSAGSVTGAHLPGWRKYYMSLGTIILIILVIALLGGFSGIGGGPFYGTGYYGGGGLGLIVVILLILLLLGKL
jgi:uncharacterized protein DUF3309